MALDYSKWDRLELSDDSDIEVHPNVDKRSFIRAKQNQIHQERVNRRHQIETLKYERLVNDGLLARIDKLIFSLRAFGTSTANIDELIFQALIQSAGAFPNDNPPPRPKNVHANVEAQPTYSQMMGTLVDMVKKEVDSSNSGNQLQSIIAELQVHYNKVDNLQKELNTKLGELEQEEARKITSDNIRTGFDSSSISKPEEKPSISKKAVPKPGAAVELIHDPSSTKPGAPQRLDSVSSGAEADTEGASEDDPYDEENPKASKEGKEFSKIPIGDYRACYAYISDHPAVIAERETDGLLVEAFNAAIDGKDARSKQCVHQALLLQYCRQLGRDGIGMFFKRIMTKDHQAKKVFTDDVNSTYARILKRGREMVAEREAEGEATGGVEQIQLHAVDPNTKINIMIPPTNSEDPDEAKAREVFESFPPGLQRALESGSLDNVNKILAKMSVEEAEEVVGQLGEGGMLSLEDQIIDATTEEGQAALKEFEHQNHPSSTHVEEGGRTEDPE
ncbi:MAG: hsp90 co-chaperone Cdc37 [Trizodia sp. TS-e1964]|nr:MAG: hsp90 co-chaperone Cdc37 [Trizodia sp. TS-e1964]